MEEITLEAVVSIAVAVSGSTVAGQRLLLWLESKLGELRNGPDSNRGGSTVKADHINGNGSLYSRMAVMEQRGNDIEKDVNEIKRSLKAIEGKVIQISVDMAALTERVNR